jgi:tRNA (adenine-N(1)-)-methyltransferase non-catalytic subunit
MGNYDFVGILQLVDPYLQRGAPVALVCQSLAPLEAAARELKTRGYLNVRLFDSWAREYQVLKNRTHPMMNMDSCSGFLLSALKMEPF